LLHYLSVLDSGSEHGSQNAGENTKKAAGNAKRAEVAAQKQAAEDSKKAKADAEDWSKGSKSNAKR